MFGSACSTAVQLLSLPLLQRAERAGYEAGHKSGSSKRYKQTTPGRRSGNKIETENADAQKHCENEGKYTRSGRPYRHECHKAWATIPTACVR